MIKNLLAIVFSLVATVACSMSDPGAIKNSALQKGVNTVVIESGHKDDVTLINLIAGKSYRPQNIKSKIYLPDTCTADKKYPLVIIDHSSGSPALAFYSTLANDLANEGIVAVTTDHYSTRGISSTTLSQEDLSYGARTLDIFSVLNYVSTLPCVDKNKIGMTGYSFGGNMTMMAVEQKYAKLLGNGTTLKAALPVYPSCQRIVRNSKSTNTRVHMILGELDQANPVKYCMEIMPYYKQRGWNITYEIYKNTHHSFISGNSPRRVDAHRYDECGNRWMEDDGSVTSDKFNINVKGDLGVLVTASKESGCIKRGYMSGGDTNIQQRLRTDTVKFFKENL